MANLNSLMTAENPLSGKSHSIFDISAWWNMILGVMMFLFVVGIGSRLANKVSAKVPAAGSPGGNIFGVPGPAVDAGPGFARYGLS